MSFGWNEIALSELSIFISDGKEAFKGFLALDLCNMLGNLKANWYRIS